MDPLSVAAALRLIAEDVELSRAPSISAVASDLESLLALVEGGDVRTAGPVDFLKGVKRKVLNTKGEKKILDKIDRLKDLQKWCGSAAKKVRKGDDLADIASDEDFLAVFEGAAEFMTEGSEALTALSAEDADVSSGLQELDEFWAGPDSEDDDEENDRDHIVNALSEFHDKCVEQVGKEKKRLDRQKTKQKGGKKLPVPRSKQKKKPEAPPREEKEEKKEPARPKLSPEEEEAETAKFSFDYGAP